MYKTVLCHMINTKILYFQPIVHPCPSCLHYRYILFLTAYATSLSFDIRASSSICTTDTLGDTLLLGTHSSWRQTHNSQMMTNTLLLQMTTPLSQMMVADDAFLAPGCWLVGMVVGQHRHKKKSQNKDNFRKKDNRSKLLKFNSGQWPE